MGGSPSPSRWFESLALGRPAGATRISTSDSDRRVGLGGRRVRDRGGMDWYGDAGMGVARLVVSRGLALVYVIAFARIGCLPPSKTH